MKQIIPFKKEIVFKSMITKITSISLENTLGLTEDSLVSGDFIVSGSYKMTEASQIDEQFSYKIPVEIAIDKKYDCTNMTFDIDDFTYEIVDEEKLAVNIELLLDNLELKPVEVRTEVIEESIDMEQVEREEQIENDEEVRESELSYKDLFLDTSVEEPLDIDSNDISANDIAEKIEQEVNKNLHLNQAVTDINQQINSNVELTPNVTSIFSAFKDTEETFSTYFVYIVREGDSLDKIMAKYKISKERLEEYNNLSEIKIGDKLIIPNNNA